MGFTPGYDLLAPTALAHLFTEGKTFATGLNLRSAVPDVRSAEANVCSTVANGKFIELLWLFLRMAHRKEPQGARNFIGI